MKTAESFQSRSPLAATLTLALFTLTANSASAVSQKFLTTGTFTPPAGITSITVECWGGGGAGGSATKGASPAGNAGGGGGGAGAYAKKLNIPVTPGIPYSVTIPAIAPGLTTFTNGETSDGASVTFTGDSGVSVTANGGQGGACVVTTTSTAVSGLGGAGGAVSGLYDVEWAGGGGWRNTSLGNSGAGGSAASDTQAGVTATTQSTGQNLVPRAGSDADHNGGQGATGKSASGAGNANNTAPGGGGGGGRAGTASTSFAGSNGKAGQIIISYSGATVTKANNTDNLNLGSSWVGGSVPGSTDTAQWDNTVTSANTTSLGANVTWGSITIIDPVGLVTINSGNTLTNNGGIDMSAATADLTLNCDYVLGNSAVWNVTSGQTLTMGGAVSGGSGLNITKQGSGKVILFGANTYSGATAFSGGTLQLGASNVIPEGSGKGDVALSGGSTLDLNGYSETVNGLNGSSGTFVDNTAASTTSTLTVGANDVSSAFGGIIKNTGTDSTTNLIKTGTGQLTLSGTNTLSGTVTVNGGNLSVQNANPLANISGLTIGGATLGFNNNNPTISAPITLTGNTTFKVQTAGVLGSLDGAIGGTGNITFATADNTLAGDNRVALGAAGGFTGNVTITTSPTSVLNSLTLQLGVVNALPTTAVVTLDGNTGNSGIQWCDLDLNGNDQTLAGLTNVTRSGRLQHVYSGSAATLTVSNSVDYTFGGRLGKTGGDEFGLTKSGAGTFTISGANSYTGATTVTGGTLALGASDVLADTTEVSIGSATLAAGAGFTDTVGTLDTTGAATINLGAGAALAFADSSAVDWTGGTLNLNGTFVSGASLRFGDGTGTGLTSTQLGLVAATGFSSFSLDANGYLTATSTGGYSSWQTANSTGQMIDLDHDNDGVSNGVEYFLGGNSNTTGFTVLPAVFNAAGTLSVTWTKAAVGYNGNYGTDFWVETSATLAAGSWTNETLGGNVTITGNAVKYTFPAGTKNFARLKVTGP
jgi:autotransporter-associated beta strand protein